MLAPISCFLSLLFSIFPVFCDINHPLDIWLFLLTSPRGFNYLGFQKPSSRLMIPIIFPPLLLFLFSMIVDPVTVDPVIVDPWSFHPRFLETWLSSDIGFWCLTWASDLTRDTRERTEDKVYAFWSFQIELKLIFRQNWKNCENSLASLISPPETEVKYGNDELDSDFWIFLMFLDILNILKYGYEELDSDF